MRRSTVIFAGLLLATGFTVASACGSDSPAPASREISAADGGKVSLSDGSLTLEVPPGALRDNTVVSVERTESISDQPDDEVRELAKYTFGPAGTVFSKPVALSFTLPVTLLQPGFLLEHSSGIDDELTEIESDVLNIGDVTLSEDGTEVIVETEISHFSTVLFRRNLFFEAELVLPATAQVGVPFVATAIARKRAEDNPLYGRSVIGSVVRTQTWSRGNDIATVAGTLYGFDDGLPNLSPTIVRSLPPSTALRSDSFTARTELACERIGEYHAEYVAAFLYEGLFETNYEPDRIGGVHYPPTTIRTDIHEVVIAMDSGECIGPSTIPTAIPSVTPTPNDLATAAAELFDTPEPPKTPVAEFDERTANSVLLDNGMWVGLDVKIGGGIPAPTLRKSWSGVVSILRYVLNVSVGPDTPEDDARQSVEFRVFADDSGSQTQISEVTGKFAGGDARDFETSLILDLEGQYIIRGTVGDKPFELTVEAVEPPLDYGVLVEPGTWAGQTPFDLELDESLINIEGTWEGNLSPPWQPGDFIKRLAAQSQIQLRLLDSYIEPVQTSVVQTAAGGSRFAFDLTLPRAVYEGTLTYHLPASDLNNEPCGGESVVYELHGTLEYLPIGGHWGADVKLIGSLSSPLPKIAAELPKSVSITATSSWDQFDEQRMIGQVINKISVRDSEGSPVGFVIEFSDFQPNPDSIIDEESNCEGGVHSIAFVATRK